MTVSGFCPIPRRCHVATVGGRTGGRSRAGEASIWGGVDQVPFADDHDFISGFLQRLRRQPFVGLKRYLWLDGMIVFWNP
jgi:hypothetical protein